MAHHLYQLQLGKTVNEVVRIDGPWDTWGYVVKLNPNGFNTIRGLGRPKTKPTIPEKTK